VFDTAATYVSLRSGYYYDLRDNALTIAPVINGTLGPEDWVALALYATEDLYVEWILFESTLIARAWGGGSGGSAWESNLGEAPIPTSTCPRLARSGSDAFRVVRW